MRYVYNFLIYLILPFLPLRLCWRGRRNRAYLCSWRERFAYYKKIPTLKNCLWLHAVSLGEAIAAIPLLQELKKKHPDQVIVVTNMTPTGAEKIRSTFGDQVLQLYVPYDYPGAVQRFLKQFNPSLLIIMETELWPNILFYTKQKQIPILLANARLSPRSFRHYQYIKNFVRQMLNCVSTVAAQSQEDGSRFLALGLSANKLCVTGNIKFDISIAANTYTDAKRLATQWQLDLNRPIWIAASTHQGEEEKILLAMRKIMSVIPEVFLILVPRHPERFDQVAQLCKAQKFAVVRYSQNPVCNASTQILIGDTMGKLLLFYALSKVAFVGGSFVPVGGHNLLEPAALVKPILTGQYLTNFLEISRLLFEANAAIKVADENELADWLVRLLKDEKQNTAMAQAAFQVVNQNKGALAKLLQLCAQ